MSGRVARYGRLLLGRTRHRMAARPRVALLSGAGDDNFGDEWMLSALRDELAALTLIPIELPRTEARLARLELSGPPYFAAVIVGGGTLINPYFLPRVLPFVDDGLPTYVLGTGVGSAGFGVTEASADPRGWVESMSRFERVLVRGPLSAERLRSAGAPDVTVLGDLALLNAPDLPAERHERGRVLVNVSGTEGERAVQATLGEAELNAALLTALTAARADGDTLHPLVMHRDDLPVLERLGLALGGWDGPVLRPRSTADVAGDLEGATSVVAMRLHAAAIGWAFGVPTVPLGYRRKTQDLAESIGLERDVIDVGTVDGHELAKRVGAALSRPDWSRAREGHRRVIALRDHQRSVLADVAREIVELSRASSRSGAGRQRWARSPGRGPTR